MRIYYDSKTGNVERFVHKLQDHTGWIIEKITADLLICHDGHLITFTTGKGEVPVSTSRFLEQNYQFIQTVATSGNRNWGMNFGKAGELLALQYGLPLLFKFELSGTKQDVQYYIDKVMNYHDYKEMDIAQ